MDDEENALQEEVSQHPALARECLRIARRDAQHRRELRAALTAGNTQIALRLAAQLVGLNPTEIPTVVGFDDQQSGH